MSDAVKTLNFSDGAQELTVNGYKIRWYPTDLEFVDRFIAFRRYAENELPARLEAIGNSIGNIDTYEHGAFTALGKEFTAELDKTFNFPVGDVFGGVNPLSPTSNGRLVYENFLDAIMPFMEDSFKGFEASREKYTIGSKNRAARRAKK